MANILIIDDDELIREVITACVADIGHTIQGAGTLSKGVRLAREHAFDLVFLDIFLPDGSGLDALPEIKGVASSPEVVIITGDRDVNGAQIALEHDAWDYILKPFVPNELRLIIKQVLEFRASKKNQGSFFDRSAIIGNSPMLNHCLNLAQQCAGSDANVLITGPTGAGKELFANTIHKNSSRKNQNFIVVDCAALPEQLVESVLFGNVKGAFTGADSKRDGLVKKADGGTLFLDEVGELPLAIQKKFLRVLQERRFNPVGGTDEIQSNFRLISATNRDLDDMVSRGEFRSDLLFRLRTFHVELPFLKDCIGDIQPLLLHYIHQICESHGMETKGFEPGFLTALQSYDWPGNVREMINCLERAILSSNGGAILYPYYLPQRIRLSGIKKTIGEDAGDAGEKDKASGDENTHLLHLPQSFFNPIKPLKLVKSYMVAETEKLYLQQLMARVDNDMDKGAEMACVSKSRLYALLKSHRISK